MLVARRRRDLLLCEVSSDIIVVTVLRMLFLLAYALLLLHGVGNVSSASASTEAASLVATDRIQRHALFYIH